MGPMPIAAAITAAIYRWVNEDFDSSPTQFVCLVDRFDGHQQVGVGCAPSLLVELVDIKWTII